jgi:hypothetical protein
MPLGADHAATTARLRRFTAAQAAQGALCDHRAHVLPCHVDTGAQHGPVTRLQWIVERAA